jgi:hypothetical protein
MAIFLKSKHTPYSLLKTIVLHHFQAGIQLTLLDLASTNPSSKSLLPSLYAAPHISANSS